MKLDKLEQPSLETLLENLRRRLLLKQRNRFTAAKAATGLTPRMNAGACAPLFGQLSTLNSLSCRTVLSRFLRRGTRRARAASMRRFPPQSAPQLSTL
jgi:hypothetical protein